jgi:tetratricopeptide (TPR) repeat protein
VRTAVEQALADAKSEDRDADRVLKLCAVLHAHEQFESAQQCYARAHALDGKRFDTLYRWSHVLAARGNYEEAAARLRAALEIRPESLPALLKLAEVLRESGDSAGSAKIARAVLQSHPASPQAHYALGRTLEGDEAVAEFEKALAIFPRYGAAQFALAAAYRRHGQEQMAQQVLRNYDRDRTLNPPLEDPEMTAVRALNMSVNSWLQQAAEQELDGKLPEAVSLYRRALNADPALVTAWVDLISLHARLGQDAEAEAAYKRAISLKPGQSDAHYNFGVFCFERGRAEEARKAFERTVESAPSHAEALHNLGAILEQQGSLNEAAALYRRAVDARPAYPLARFHLGRIYANQKKFARAVAEFEKSLEPAGENTPAYRYALAATHARAGNVSRALELLRIARREAEAHGQKQVVAGIDRDLAALGNPR